MSVKQTYYLLIASIALLLIGLVGGAYGANQLLTKRSTTLVSLRAKNQAQTQEQTILTQAKRDIQRYSDLEAITSQVVPEDKDQAEAVRELANIAAKYKIGLASVSFPSSTLGASPVTKSSTTAPTTPSSAAAAQNSKATVLSQLVAVKSIPGVYALTIQVNSDKNSVITYDTLIQFLSALEQNRRTSQVTSINIQPRATDPSKVDFSLTLNEYIKP